MWNLTHTPERQECCFQWWPGRFDIVLFQSMPVEAEETPGTGGYLTAVGIDGQGYHILDPEHPFGAGQFAPSPDGQTIAYGDGQTSWLYQQGGSQVFNPA